MCKSWRGELTTRSWELKGLTCLNYVDQPVKQKSGILGRLWHANGAWRNSQKNSLSIETRKTSTNEYYSGEKKNQSREFVMTSLWMLVIWLRCKPQIETLQKLLWKKLQHFLSSWGVFFIVFIVAHKEIKFDVVLIWRWVLITKEFKLHTLKPDSALGVLYLRCFRTFTSSN